MTLSTQSSAEQWRSGQLLWPGVALSSTDLEPLSKVARVTQICRFVEVIRIASKPGSSLSHSKEESSPPAARPLAPNLNKSGASAVLSH